MSDLKQRITSAVMESGLSDSDQRSALGLARTWAEKRKPVTRSQISGYEKRDNLALELVGLMEEAGAGLDECRAALHHARTVVNRPFQTGSSARGEHLELLKPKDGGN